MNYKPGVLEHSDYRFGVLMLGHAQLFTDQSSRNHARGDRFAMSIDSVVSYGLQGMADGVTEIKNGPQAFVPLVELDDTSLDLTRPRYGVFEPRRLKTKKPVHFARQD